jgi:carbohydrate-selective porin OprB
VELPAGYRRAAVFCLLAAMRLLTGLEDGGPEVMAAPPQLGVFARAGFSQTEGMSRTSYAASTGLQWTAPLWDRPRDRLGAGYSFQREAALGEEHLAEAYYNMFLTDHLSVIGNLQWLFYGPNQETGKTNRNVLIPGIRTVVGF